MVLTKNITSPSLYLYWKLCSIKKRYCTFFHKYRFITWSNKTFPSTRNNFKTRFISKCDLQFVTVILTVTKTVCTFCFPRFTKTFCVFFLFHTFYKNRFMFLQKLFCFYKKLFCVFTKTVCTFCFTRFTKNRFMFLQKLFCFYKNCFVFLQKLFVLFVSCIL